MADYWLSILIPVYNTEPYLRDCMNSISGQWQQGIEVIFLDDSSTDNSRSELTEIESSIGYVRVIYHDVNKGLSQARNTLLDYARGKYVWFLDSDDYILPEAIGDLKHALCDSPEMLLFDYRVVPDGSNIKLQDPEGSRYIKAFIGKSREMQYNKQSLFYGLFKSRRFQAWARITKKSVWDKSPRFPVGKYFEDIYNTPYLALHVNSYRYLHQALVAYRSREESIVRQPDMIKVRDFLAGPNGVIDAWQLAGVDIGRRERFQYIHYCGVIFINALKMLKKAGLMDRESTVEVRSLYFKSCGMSWGKIVVAYLRQGKFLALYRLSRYLRGSKSF